MRARRYTDAAALCGSLPGHGLFVDGTHFAYA
jgi:hypothetical protein